MEIKSKETTANKYSMRIKKMVQSLADLPGVTGAEDDNTTVRKNGNGIYGEGQTILSEYVQASLKDSQVISKIGQRLSSLDKSLGGKMGGQ